MTSSVCLAGRCGDGKCSCGESVHTCATDCKRVICIANKCFRSQAQAARKWASLLKQMDLPRGRGTACLLARLNAWTSLGVGV